MRTGLQNCFPSLVYGAVRGDKLFVFLTGKFARRRSDIGPALFLWREDWPTLVGNIWGGQNNQSHLDEWSV